MIMFKQLPGLGVVEVSVLEMTVIITEKEIDITADEFQYTQ